MALNAVKQKYIPKSNDFYRDHYHHVIIGLMVIIVLMTIAVSIVLYQILHKPLPVFYAQQPDGQKLTLVSFNEPNLLPDTILKWAGKAATAAYTFNFLNYNQQLAAARPNFTEAGWNSYLLSVKDLIEGIIASKIFVYSVVAGTPVISNQGDLPGQGYTWRVQIPFLVTYQGTEAPYNRKFLLLMTIVRVPTYVNPQGIGIDQFVMI